MTGRGQILKINSCSIGREIGKIWTAQKFLQAISFKSGRLLERRLKTVWHPRTPDETTQGARHWVPARILRALDSF
jgi:hypothetical protein